MDQFQGQSQSQTAGRARDAAACGRGATGNTSSEKKSIPPRDQTTARVRASVAPGRTMILPPIRRSPSSPNPEERSLLRTALATSFRTYGGATGRRSPSCCCGGKRGNLRSPRCGFGVVRGDGGAAAAAMPSVADEAFFGGQKRARSRGGMTCGRGRERGRGRPRRLVAHSSLSPHGVPASALELRPAGREEKDGREVGYGWRSEKEREYYACRPRSRRRRRRSNWINWGIPFNEAVGWRPT